MEAPLHNTQHPKGSAISVLVSDTHSTLLDVFQSSPMGPELPGQHKGNLHNHWT